MAETLVERIHALARKCAEQDALLKSLIAEVNVESLEKPYTAYKADPADIVLDKLQDGALVVTDSPATTNFRLPNVGEIVTSLVPLDDAALHLLDGAKLSMNGMYKEGLEKIVATYDSTPLTANVHKVGNLVENGTVISGFSADNYAKIPYVFSPENNPWEMVFKITTGADVTAVNTIFGSDIQSESIQAFVYQGHFQLYASSTNASFDITNGVSGTYNVQTNTTYYVKIQFTGTAYTVAYSTDGTNFITDITVNSTVAVNSGRYIQLGVDVNRDNVLSNPFLGSIDLSASYININNTRWWSGAKRGIFTTEAEWQSCVNQHRACGKFVYDSIAKTVRLPKVSGFTEGTLDSNALGDLVEAGLSNITGGNFRVVIAELGGSPNGAFSGSAVSKVDVSTTRSNDLYSTSFNASRSSSVYGNSDTVQPQSTKVFYYIVLANTISTPVVANIQREVDSKVSAEEAAHAAMPSEQHIEMTLPANGGTVTAPADGYIRFTARTGAGQTNGYAGLGGGPFRSWYGFPIANTPFFVTVPVCAGQSVTVVYNTTGSNQMLEFFYANGSAPTN